MHIEEFVTLHNRTIALRRLLVAQQLERRTSIDVVSELSEIAAAIERSVDESGVLEVVSPSGAYRTRADYERLELARDLAFAGGGMDAVLDMVDKADASVSEQASFVAESLSGIRFAACFTDRDGTVNGYANRYSSSVQPAHVAVALTRFVSLCCDRAVVLTAGPMRGPGVVDLSVMPEGTVIFAASKGREIELEDGRRIVAALPAETAAVLDRLNAELERVYERPEFGYFRYVGSGYQRKFGEVSVSFQDWQMNCPAGRSEEFRSEVHRAVRRVDPTESLLYVDTGARDLEISVPGTGANGAAFDKGDGALFVAEKAGIPIEGRLVLVCGDTYSDIPMLERIRDAGARLESVFVTEDEELKEKVRSVYEETIFVDQYEALVLGMHLSVTEEEHEYLVV